MNALVLGVAATVLGIVVHAIVLRRLRPVWRLLALPVLLLLALAGLMALAPLPHPPLSLADGVVALVLSLSLGLAYALLLNGVIHDSPTLALVNAIERHGTDGMPVSAFDAVVAHHPFLTSRFEALVRAGEIAEVDGVVHLTGKTGHLLLFADAYRWLRGETSADAG